MITGLCRPTFGRPETELGTGVVGVQADHRQAGLSQRPGNHRRLVGIGHVAFDGIEASGSGRHNRVGKRTVGPQEPEVGGESDHAPILPQHATPPGLQWPGGIKIGRNPVDRRTVRTGNPYWRPVLVDGHQFGEHD